MSQFNGSLTQAESVFPFLELISVEVFVTVHSLHFRVDVGLLVFVEVVLTTSFAATHKLGEDVIQLVLAHEFTMSGYSLVSIRAKVSLLTLHVDASRLCNETTFLTDNDAVGVVVPESRQHAVPTKSAIYSISIFHFFRLVILDFDSP